MKKQYISPSMKAYTVKTVAILAGSDLTKGTGTQPTVADGKGGNFFDDDWR